MKSASRPELAPSRRDFPLFESIKIRGSTRFIELRNPLHDVTKLQLGRRPYWSSQSKFNIVPNISFLSFLSLTVTYTLKYVNTLL